MEKERIAGLMEVNILEVGALMNIMDMGFTLAQVFEASTQY